MVLPHTCNPRLQQCCNNNKRLRVVFPTTEFIYMNSMYIVCMYVCALVVMFVGMYVCISACMYVRCV